MDAKNQIASGLLTPTEFAARLDVSPARVAEWVRDGRIPAVKLGRLALIPEDALQRVLDRPEWHEGPR